MGPARPHQPCPAAPAPPAPGHTPPDPLDHAQAEPPAEHGRPAVPAGPPGGASPTTAPTPPTPAPESLPARAVSSRCSAATFPPNSESRAHNSSVTVKASRRGASSTRPDFRASASHRHTVRTDTPADSAAIRACTDDNCPVSSSTSRRPTTTRRINARSPDRDTNGFPLATETGETSRGRRDDVDTESAVMDTSPLAHQDDAHRNGRPRVSHPPVVVDANRTLRQQLGQPMAAKTPTPSRKSPAQRSLTPKPPAAAQPADTTPPTHTPFQAAQEIPLGVNGSIPGAATPNRTPPGQDGGQAAAAGSTAAGTAASGLAADQDSGQGAAAGTGTRRRGRAAGNRRGRQTGPGRCNTARQRPGPSNRTPGHHAPPIRSNTDRPKKPIQKTEFRNIWRNSHPNTRPRHPNHLSQQADTALDPTGHHT
ncbi:hypothetical protein P3T27_007861 [Kitasatospora sp. MAA19]|nr:hypothetical protein [Kitasatospora sp. MAA19]